MIMLKELRKRKGMRQADLCKLVGVAQPTLSGWESGKCQVDDAIKIKLAEIFNVTIDELMGIKNAPLPVYTDEEAQLLEDFRKLSPAGQAAALGVVHAYTLMSEYAKKTKLGGASV